MDIQSVKESVINSLKSASTVVVNSASWLGHKVSTFIVPAITKAFEATKSASNYAFTLAKANPLAAFAISGILLALGSVSFSCSDRSEDEDDEQNSSCAATAWRVAGTVAFVAGTAALGLAVAAVVV